MTSRKLAAGSAFPAIDLPVLGGGRRALAPATGGSDWTLVVVYRGRHCPLCRDYLRKLGHVLPDLLRVGVDVVAVSADSESRARLQMVDVLPEYEVAYGLTVPQMQALGLYISEPRSGMDVEAPFAEPGLFVVDEIGALRIVDISNVPFSRPDLEGIAKGIGFLRGSARNAPINGTYA